MFTEHFAVTILDALAHASFVHVVYFSRHIVISRLGLDKPLTIALWKVIRIRAKYSFIGFSQSLIKTPSISFGPVWM